MTSEIIDIPHRLKSYLPKQLKKEYPAVGRCIYCSGTETLSTEHIVPLGLGGRMELPKASCLECNKKTSTFEHTCLRTMYGPLRLLYDLPSRRKRNRPEALPLKIQYKQDGEWTTVPVEQNRYPFLLPRVR